MKTVRLTKEEKVLEESLIRNEYVSVSKKEFQAIADAIAVRKKDAVLNIRINRQDLESIKAKSKKLGVKYQTFISEVLHRLAQG